MENEKEDYGRDNYNDYRREKRDKQVNEFKEFLAKNGITYETSNIPNVVIVDNYYLSLKKYRGCYKIKLKDSFNEWRGIREKKVLQMFSKIK